MRRRIVISALRHLTLVAALVGLVAVAAPSARAQDAPSLGLGAPAGAPGLELPRRLEPKQKGPYGDDRVPPEWAPTPRWRRPWSAYPRYIGPWGWYVPQTETYKSYPPPVALEPRLGLMYNYPYAWQMGIEVPYDSDPITTYSLGPYTGVVRSPHYPAWLHEVESPSAISLMRAGKFRQAGKLLADAFQDSDEPEAPLLLAEALFALGKYRHAQLVLEHALMLDSVWKALPGDVASHFPSAPDYEKRVAALVAEDTAPLLTAYLLLFSEDGTRGLDRLVGLMAEEPKDESVKRLYRHYVGKAFGPAETSGEERPAPKPAPTDDSPRAETPDA